MEKDLGTDELPAYLFHDANHVEKCNCGRIINLYDFYITGKSVHGSAQFHGIIRDKPYKIQLKGTEANPTVVCTKCHTRHTITHSYHYIVGGYCYA